MTTTTSTVITSVVLDADDPAAGQAFYAALGVADRISVRAAQVPSTGFRGYTLSIVVAQPNDVDAFVDTAVSAGATVVTPVKKSLWGYGGVVQAPDGAVWKVASSSKKNTGPATGRIESLVLLLGVDDVKATKAFYVDRGLSVAKSFGRKYVEFTAPESAVTLALLGRAALAKDAGTDPAGTGSHRITIVSDGGSFTDPDGFVWDALDSAPREP
ncbi:glyoxalase [Rhodococcus sp. D2-41]|uniref:Glyoxalase n=1 Tax=Speluncibacter jeojiensis TaxID=2710754 RepID=A0A9X4LYU1_9ACTN|nr:glyoxalase [Rhodococcus sp. D2-41]MDG3010700.1 glyoxalase [Rhodococcus sp. D2-41]MDG3013682.1 glyoxalase [Corynebacteriales bacterium D3-21]